MRNFDYYEFTGDLLPGVILLLGLGQIPEAFVRAPYLVPDATGEFGLYLVLAYVAGHFVQVIGQILERWFWVVMRGLPTDKPYDKRADPKYKPTYELTLRLTGEGTSSDKGDWGRRISILRSAANRTTGANRLNIFNGTYGMFRGFLTVGLIGLSLAWAADYEAGWAYLFVGIFTVAAAWRMRHFGHRYATELFAIARQEDKM